MAPEIFHKAATIPGGLMPFWMLNDASTVAEKIDYMRRCHAGGIDMLTMHPRAGNLIPFASDEWFHMVKSLVNEAARLGMKLWLYDEDPFPSGAAGGLVMAERPDLIAKGMQFKTAPESLNTGELWQISEERVLWAGLIPHHPGLQALNLTASVGPLRTDWFATDWDSRYYYYETPYFPCVRGATVRMVYAMRVPEIPHGYQLAAVVQNTPGVDGPWGTLPDLINPKTFDVFARLGLEPYVKIVGRHFGKTILGIFTDEAKAHGATPYTADLFPSFKKRFGYDLRQNLYRLFGEPTDDDTIRTRIDYRLWIRDRFLNGFARPYAKWCNDHGLYLVGHFSPEDDPIEEAMTLPACMPIMQTMGLPGCDVIVPSVGDEKSPTLNLGSLRVGSVKSQLARPYGCSETQGLNDWIITSRKTRQIYAWQKVLGVDRFFTHGFFSSNDGITNYEAPPDYGPHSSIFRGTCAVNSWLKKCDSLCDHSREVADVAILDNVFSYWKWASGMDLRLLQKWRNSWWLTILHCLQSQIGIHALYSDDAATGKLVKGGLKIGQRVYNTILVPQCGYIEKHVLEQLDKAVQAGIRVVWLGNGPQQVVARKGAFTPVTKLPGTTLASAAPLHSWLKTNLTPQVYLKGADSKNLYVRRFLGADNKEYLLAVNVSDTPLTVTLLNNHNCIWQPVADLFDGKLTNTGGGQRWHLPGMGCAMFTIVKEVAKLPSLNTVRKTNRDRTFTRLSPNTLRLDACTITLKGHPPQQRPYPEPLWQRFSDYHATASIETFAGVMPTASTVYESDLRYTFTFESETNIKNVELILTPVVSAATSISGATSGKSPPTSPSRSTTPPPCRSRSQYEKVKTSLSSVSLPKTPSKVSSPTSPLLATLVLPSVMAKQLSPPPPTLPSLMPAGSIWVLPTIWVTVSMNGAKLSLPTTSPRTTGIWS